MREQDYAVDADRTPRDPELVAGDPRPDPWETDPNRWADTEPVSPPSDDRDWGPSHG